jgi:hypothetical protein
MYGNVNTKEQYPIINFTQFPIDKGEFESAENRTVHSMILIITYIDRYFLYILLYAKNKKKNRQANSGSIIEAIGFVNFAT